MPIELCRSSMQHGPHVIRSPLHKNFEGQHCDFRGPQDVQCHFGQTKQEDRCSNATKLMKDWPEVSQEDG